MDYLDDTNETKRIAKETVEYLRSLKDQKISTGKIAAAVTDALREAYANKIKYLEGKVEAQDHKIKEQEGFLAKLRRGLNGIVK